MLVENPLAQFSVEPLKESRRLRLLAPSEQADELLQNLRGYENEVLMDSPVSIMYSYWFDEAGEPYSHPSKKEVHRFKDQFDPQERGVFPLRGFERVVELMRQNPGKVILWYSPKGPATFDSDPNNPYKDINFTYGQLYVQYYDEAQDKAFAVAIKVTNETIFSRLTPDVYNSLDQQSDAATLQNRIETFLLNPVNTSLTIDEFVEKSWDVGYVYRDKSGEKHGFDEVLSHIRKKLADHSDNVSARAQWFTRKLLHSSKREEDVLRTYLEFVRAYQQDEGKTLINLMGACGGRIVTASEIDKLLGISNDPINIYSTAIRLLAQSSLTKDVNDRHDDYKCPGCGRVHQGEVKGSDPETWTKECACGFAFNCAPESKAA